MAEKFGRLALHMWTIDTTPLKTALDAAKQGGFDAVELRRTDFKRCFRRRHEQRRGARPHPRRRHSRRRAGCRIWLAVRHRRRERAAVQGVPRVLRERRGARLRHADERAGPGQRPIPQAIEYLRRAGDIAGEYGLKLAIEYNSQHDVLNSLPVLRQLIEGANKPNCGYLIDAYHFQRSGYGGRELPRLAERHDLLLPVQRCLAPSRHRHSPPNRSPGARQGHRQWRDVLSLLHDKNYTGYLSYEAPNPELWERSPYDVAREGVELTRKLLRDAVPGYSN